MPPALVSASPLWPNIARCLVVFHTALCYSALLHSPYKAAHFSLPPRVGAIASSSSQHTALLSFAQQTALLAYAASCLPVHAKTPNPRHASLLLHCQARRKLCKHQQRLVSQSVGPGGQANGCIQASRSVSKQQSTEPGPGSCHCAYFVLDSTHPCSSRQHAATYTDACQHAQSTLPVGGGWKVRR